MIEELKITILNRVISELFQEADKLIKEGIKLTEKNKNLVTIGLSISVAGLLHVLCPAPAAVALDVINLFMTLGIVAGTKVDKVKSEVAKVQDFFTHFSLQKEDICSILKVELTSDLRIGTYFSTQEINTVINNGILNLRREEIEMFSKIRFNDQQEKYLKEIISKNEKINVINFLDLSMLESSVQNQKFINLGGKNKTLKDIMSPEKKLKLMK